MRILHYYAGAMTESMDSVAAAERLRNNQYNFRYSPVFVAPELCDAIVSDEDRIIEAYKAVGVEVYEPKPFDDEGLEFDDDEDKTLVDQVPTLDDDKETLVAYLVDLSSDDTDLFWSGIPEQDMADYLVANFDLEQKEGWTRHMMVEMVEKRLGLSE